MDFEKKTNIQRSSFAFSHTDVSVEARRRTSALPSQPGAINQLISRFLRSLVMLLVMQHVGEHHSPQSNGGTKEEEPPQLKIPSSDPTCGGSLKQREWRSSSLRAAEDPSHHTGTTHTSPGGPQHTPRLGGHNTHNTYAGQWQMAIIAIMVIIPSYSL